MNSLEGGTNKSYYSGGVRYMEEIVIINLIYITLFIHTMQHKALKAIPP